MPDKFGFTEARWEEGKQEITGILQGVASRRQMITYGELSRKLSSIQIGPHDSAMAAMLGQISKEEDRLGRGMLSVLVVHKSGDMEPGNGFYECAAELGKDISDRVKLWVSELHRVLGSWAH